MPFYEHVFIARQDISSAQVDGLVETFKGLVENDGGKIVDTEYWGLKNLAYRIKKNRKGHYVMLNIEAPVAAINELERNERLHEDVLRYLTLRVDELEEGPSVMARGRKERSGRDRDDSYRPRSGEGDKPAAASEDKPAESAPAASTPAESTDKPAAEEIPVTEDTKEPAE
jgi:small subunit ribosomal protein S6